MYGGEGMGMGVRGLPNGESGPFCVHAVTMVTLAKTHTIVSFGIPDPSDQTVKLTSILLSRKLRQKPQNHV